MRWFTIFCLSVFSLFSSSFVTVQFNGQLGNNLFEAAAAHALAWDHQAECYFLPLEPKEVMEHVFFRCKFQSSLPVHAIWKEPALSYRPIPFVPNLLLVGYFQSEKYFAHHRARILELFTPRADDLEYMHQRYRWLIDHPNTVGIQVRYYQGEDPSGVIYPQYGKDYFSKAMALFSESALFVVSSNNLAFARSQIPAAGKNVVFLENEPPYIDLFLLSFCKHNIISNSSFGWWAAWLNQNPEKTVVCPQILFHGLPTQDYCPAEWLRIDALPLFGTPGNVRNTVEKRN